MKIVTAAEMREIDRATSERYGIPSLSLMENAGQAVATHVLALSPERVLVVCGKGNNGGDGFVTAHHLQQHGVHVEVVMLAEAQEYSGDAAEMLSRLQPAPRAIRGESAIRELFGEISGFDVVVDALLGTGFRPPLSGEYAAAVEGINALGCRVHAVDIPSGLEADRMSPQTGTFVHADATTTLTAFKPALVFSCDPRTVTVAEIGTPAEAILSSLHLNLVHEQDVAFITARRDPQSNKGTYGHVLVLGGSAGKAGAPSMTAMAALRAGAGLVTVACPKSVLPIVAGFAPEIMTISLDETASGGLSVVNFERMKPLAEGKRAIAVGPGAGQDEEAQQFLRAFTDRCEVPVILDADGLNAFAGHVNQLTPIRHPLILTPHPGEMARLAQQSIAEIQGNRINVARWFAQEHGCYLVLKGHRTVIAEPNGEVWINVTGNAGMATGGTGDVLTGIIAGFVSQYPEHMAAAVIAAVYLHGLAGDLAVEEQGEHGMIATDLIALMPQAFKTLALRAGSAEAFSA